MDVAEKIIQEALACDVVLYLKDGRLAYVVGGGVFPDALRERIGAHKEGIIDYLWRLDANGSTQGPHMPSILPVARDGHLPLSFAQQRLWFIA
ncbi:MAG: hypothetical protein WBW32_06200, partial [Luteibacter sp.]